MNARNMLSKRCRIKLKIPAVFTIKMQCFVANFFIFSTEIQPGNYRCLIQSPNIEKQQISTNPHRNTHLIHECSCLNTFHIPAQCCLPPRAFILNNSASRKTLTHPQRLFIAQNVHNTVRNSLSELIVKLYNMFNNQPK